MTTLKKASIMVSKEHRDRRVDDLYHDKEYYGLVHCHLTGLTIAAAPDVTCQTMLDRYAYMVLKLQHLTFHYYSGECEPKSGEFTIALPRYSLNSLTIDLTPLKEKTLKYIKSEFFVIVLETQNNNKRLLFKVTHDLSTIESISDDDLKEFALCVDYFRVRINIRRLKRLDLCVGEDVWYRPYPSRSDMKSVICCTETETLKHSLNKK